MILVASLGKSTAQCLCGEHTHESLLVQGGREAVDDWFVELRGQGFEAFDKIICFEVDGNLGCLMNNND